MRIYFSRNSLSKNQRKKALSSLLVLRFQSLFSLVLAIGAAKHEAFELEVAFEQLVNEIDHNREYSQSAQEPDDSPEENNNYDCKNQQKQVLNASLDSHALNNVVFQ